MIGSETFLIFKIDLLSKFGKVLKALEFLFQQFSGTLLLDFFLVPNQVKKYTTVLSFKILNN